MITTDLRIIAAHLEGLEESIIHRLIDRAQFAANHVAYERGHSGFSDNSTMSLFEIRLKAQEEMDAEFGRFMVPEERPFHRDLPPPQRRVDLPPSPLDPHAISGVNRTPAIVAEYLDYIPVLSRSGDDGQYGSSVEHDVLAIQAIGRRVHYGSLYVAEAKYRGDPGGIASATATAAAGNREPLRDLITRADVEEAILRRIRDKVSYIQASLNPELRRRVDEEIVIRLYQETIIPQTKEGEIDYLIARQKGPEDRE